VEKQMNPVTPTAIITVQQREILGEIVIYLGPDCLVAAKSRPGHYYIVTDGASCTCDGFTHRQHCRHLAAAKEVEMLERASATPDPDPAPSAPAARAAAAGASDFVPWSVRRHMPYYAQGYAQMGA
jgi:hypothetical protein